MKKSNLFLSLLMAITVLSFTACNDEPVIDPSEGIPVGDGFYFAEVGVDPAATAVLTSAMVDAPSFGAMAREGFVQGYAYLTAGNYNLVEVEEKAIINTYGGTLTAVAGADAHNAECDESGYNLVMAEADGAAFAVATDGLYVITYDATLGEIVYDQITSVGIIGGATPGGWSDDTALTGSVTADGGSWTLEGVTISDGQMKFRYNCRWAIDRRIDTGADFDNANGYSLFTNYGNTIDNLLPGNEGPNIEVAERAVYTVDFTWDPSSGVAATLTRTGDAEPLPEYPAAMYLVGAGTAYGWTGPGDASHNGADAMHLIAGGSTAEEGIFWKILYLEAGQGFKISAAGWADPNLGFAEVDEYDANGVTVSDNGGNMDIAVSGMYMVVLNLQNNLKKVSIVAPKVYGIGGAFGAGDWTEDDATTLFTVDDAAKTITSPALTADADIRSYVDHAWITAWWNAEFYVDGGVIVYRNDGGDLPAVAGTTGQVITYTFDDNTGTIQ
ncbi:MAG: SusF/SusE family outer membrane protein [Bacteroidota bacterium]